jgi:hypothetical protein
LSAAALPAALNFALPTIMPHGINSGKALTFSVKRNDQRPVGWVERSDTHQSPPVTSMGIASFNPSYALA